MNRMSEGEQIPEQSEAFRAPNEIGFGDIFQYESGKEMVVQDPGQPDDPFYQTLDIQHKEGKPRISGGSSVLVTEPVQKTGQMNLSTFEAEMRKYLQTMPFLTPEKIESRILAFREKAKTFLEKRPISDKAKQAAAEQLKRATGSKEDIMAKYSSLLKSDENEK